MGVEIKITFEQITNTFSEDIMRFIKVIFPIAVSVALVACGGGGGSDSDSDEGAADLLNKKQQGYFIDSGVDGLNYTSSPSGLSGVTSNGGRFDYESGDTVTFYIGNLQLGGAAAAGVITPMGLADTNDPADSKAINISRLLQTLDADGDPDNGIDISTEVQAAAAQLAGEEAEVDFSGGAFAVEAQKLIDAIDSNKPELVSAADAQNHLENSLEDTDGDGEVNGIDDDDDNDGVADYSDAFPLDSTESIDTDSDGTGNNADTDDDGDGIADVEDSQPLGGSNGSTWDQMQWDNGQWK